LKGFQKLISVDYALKSFLSQVDFKPKKTVLRLESCLNRVLAEDIVANTDLPRDDRSTVDGFAVDAAETEEASQAKPRIFELTSQKTVDKGQAEQAWTGNILPKGSNAIVMLENTKIVGNKVEVWIQATEWENVSRKGEEIHKGKVAVHKGRRLKPQHLGFIASFGIAEVEVFKNPKIAVLVTGNELAELGQSLNENQIYDSNRLVLSALCHELGVETVDLGLAEDEIDEISEKLKLGLEKADGIITSGGTSVGGPDLVPDAVNALGTPGVVVHGVAMRPGMPTGLAIVRGKPVLMLPGNPAAALLGFEVFGRPLVSKLLGLNIPEPRPILKAKMSRRITMTLGRKNLVRVRVIQSNGELLAEPISARGSGLISTVTRSNGYVVAPENSEGLAEGDMVLVHMLDDVEVG
jgi:molybdopterin molybdotransferase